MSVHVVPSILFIAQKLTMTAPSSGQDSALVTKCMTSGMAWQSKPLGKEFNFVLTHMGVEADPRNTKKTDGGLDGFGLSLVSTFIL